MAVLWGIAAAVVMAYTVAGLASLEGVHRRVRALGVSDPSFYVTVLYYVLVLALAVYVLVSVMA